MTANPPSSKNGNGMRALLGFLLLLPACILCSSSQLVLTLGAFANSLRAFSFQGAEEFVGLTNYTKLFGSPLFLSSFGYTLLLAFLHVLLATIFPPLLAFAVHALAGKLRLGVRLLFTLPLAFFGPALIMFGPAFLRGLWNPEALHQTYLLLDLLAGLAVACGVGLVIYSAVLRGRGEAEQRSNLITRPFMVTWLVAQLATAAYVFQSFNSLSSLLVPRGSVPLASILFQTVRNAQGGLTLALSNLLLVIVALFGVIATLLIILGRLQLRLKAENETIHSPAHGTSNTLGWIVLIISAVVTLAVTVVPLLFSLFKTLTSLGDTFDALNISILRVWVNTILPPLLGIFLVQVPVAYLGALGIGAMRPLGKGSPWLLLLFSPWLFVTSLPLAFAAFQNLRNVDLLDSFLALMPPLLLNVPMLFILTLFFMGQEPAWQKARAEGMTASSAFFKQLFLPSLPLVLFMASVSLLASTQELFMPLLVGMSPDQVTATTAILRITGSFAGASASSLIVSLFGLPVVLMFFVVFAALQVFYLNRLAVIREPSGTEPANVEEMKPADG